MPRFLTSPLCGIWKKWRDAWHSTQREAHTRMYARRRKHKGWKLSAFKSCRAEEAEVPYFLWGPYFSHNILSGLCIPLFGLDFMEVQRTPPLLSSVTRLCVASVAVSPYNLTENQNRCPGVCFHVYFPRLVARKILMESVAVTPVTKGFGLSLIIGTHCYPLDFYIIFF